MSFAILNIHKFLRIKIPADIEPGNHRCDPFANSTKPSTLSPIWKNGPIASDDDAMDVLSSPLKLIWKDTADPKGEKTGEVPDEDLLVMVMGLYKFEVDKIFNAFPLFRYPFVVGKNLKLFTLIYQ